MRYQDPDDAVLHYFELQESLGSIPSTYPFRSVGEVCRSCKRGRKIEVSKVKYRKPNKGRREHWKYVCSDCHRPWQGEAVYESKGGGGRPAPLHGTTKRPPQKRIRPKASRPSRRVNEARLDTLDRYSLLGAALEEIDAWPRRVYLLYAGEQPGSYEVVTGIVNQRIAEGQYPRLFIPTARHPHSREVRIWHVRQLVTRGRSQLQEILERRGLM